MMAGLGHHVLLHGDDAAVAARRVRRDEPDRRPHWWGIQPISAGLWGVPLGLRGDHHREPAHAGAGPGDAGAGRARPLSEPRGRHDEHASAPERRQSAGDRRTSPAARAKARSDAGLLFWHCAFRGRATCVAAGASQRAAPRLSRAAAACPRTTGAWRGSCEAREIRVRVSAMRVRVAQVEIAERAAGGDVGERVAFAVAPGLVVELARELRDAGVDLLLLPRDPFLALLRARAAGARARCSSAASQMPSASASQRLTTMRWRDGSGISRDTGLTVSRYSTMTRESKSAVPSSSTSTGTLPSGLHRVDRIVRRPRRNFEQLVFDLLFRERDAHLARVRTCRRERSA